MDINEKFEQFMVETPTKRFHQALKKDGSAKIDKRFRAFKSAVDPVRAKRGEEEEERKMAYKIMDEEIQDFLEDVLDDIVESAEELSDETLEEAYKFAKRRVGSSSRNSTKTDLDTVKSKVMAKAKENLLKRAIEAVKKYDSSDKHSRKSTEFKASDIFKAYGLDRNLGLSRREFVDIYKASEKSNIEKVPNVNLAKYIGMTQSEYKKRILGEEIEVNENVMKKIKNVIRGKSEEDLQKQVDKMPQDAVKKWVNSISHKSARRVLTPSDYIKYTYARNKLGLSENCGREGTDKVTKKYKKDTPGQ